MGWLGVWLLLSIGLKEVLLSPMVSQPKRTKRQMRIYNNTPEVFTTTKVGNTFQLKYFLDSDIVGTSYERGWNKVIKLFEEKTCLKFVKVNQPGDGIAKLTQTVPSWLQDSAPTAPCYVAGFTIYLGGGCGGEHYIGTMLHEFMHLLGFWHTAQRADRDKYLNVEVKRGRVSSQTVLLRDTATDFPFDYGSIVSYPEEARCDETNCYNVTARDVRYRGGLGGQQTMQFFDYYMVNHYYKCLELCDQKNHKCQNSGYPKPTDCSKCVCPPGYGGDYCTDRESSCGETYTAGSEWKTIRLEKTGLHPGVDDEKCYHLIKAPPGKWIEYDISAFAPLPWFHVYFFGNEDARMSPHGFNIGRQTREELDQIKHGVYRGNALRFKTGTVKPKAFTTTVSYRYVDQNSSANSTGLPTTFTPKPTTPQPDEPEDERTHMIGHHTCVPFGAKAPPTLFDRGSARTLLQLLTGTANPKFMIVEYRERENFYCPGKELYDYQDGIAKLTQTVPSWLQDSAPTAPCYVAGFTIYLGGGCGGEHYIGTMLHEFMHLLGFWHTAQRADRDKYLNVEVKRGRVSSQTVLLRDTATDFPFDYGSIVSYPEEARCDETNCYNVTARDVRYRGGLGGQQTMQFFDYYMVNHYYKCLELCDQKNHKCQNSGYPKPTDCSKCVCPPGYGGDYCTDRESSCGETYTAGSEWKTIRLEKTGLHPGVDDEKCYHLIKAPPGKWIEYDISAFAPLPWFHVYFFGNEDARMSPHGFNIGRQTREELDQIKHGVYRGNALRFKTGTVKPKAFTTTVSYRYVDQNSSANSTGLPTTFTPKPTTPQPDEPEDERTHMIGHHTCVPFGAKAPPTLFDRGSARTLLQLLTGTANPKFMIVEYRERENFYCPGKELYDYQLTYDTSSDDELKNILLALYLGGFGRFENMPAAWEKLTGGEMQQLYDLTLNHRFRDSVDNDMYDSPAPPFAVLHHILETTPGFTVIVDESS